MSESAYRRQLVEHLPRIRALVGAIARNQGQHDDIVQECLTHVIAQEHLWDARRGRIEGWFNTLSRRVTYRFLQRQRRRASKENAMPDIDVATAEPVVDEDQIRWVFEQYAELPADLREVLHLRYHEALSVTEVGRRLGISQQAASKRLAKALAHLQRRARASGLMSILLPWHWPFIHNSGAPMKIAATLAAASLVASPFFLPSPDTDLVAPTTQLPHTTVVVSPASPMDAAENTIWCSSVQMCWNEVETMLGGPVAFQGEQPPAGTDLLNASTLTADHVDDAALVAGAGLLANGIIEELQAELDDKFGQGRDPILDGIAEDLAHGARPWIGYAFLYKDLPFEHRFEVIPPFAFTGVPTARGATAVPVEVPMFGIRKHDEDFAESRKLASQVRIAHFASQSEHIARLLPANGKDEILLCRVPPGATLRATWEEARRRMGGFEEIPLGDGDRLLVPKFDFDLHHTFGEFAGRKFANPGWEKAICQLFAQTIRFRLDERGAELKSRTTLVAEERAEPRRLDYTGPFLVVLKERAQSEPYFMMWVANAEILVKPATPQKTR